MSEKKQGMIRRRIVFIEKSFQTRFILKFCLLGLGAMVLASLLLYWLSADSYTVSYQYHHLAMDRTSDAIVPALVGTNISVFLALAVFTVYVTLYVSFRIGGPLYRFSQDMAVIAQGKLNKRVRLRQGDQLQKFAEAINDMTGQLEVRARTLQDQIESLQKQAEDPDCDLEQLRAQIDRLNQAAHDVFNTRE
jgi:methyl-accepting chemotaxis protein